METEKEFTPIFVKRPHEKAPDFVKCELSFKRQDMLDWLSQKTDEYINLTMKTSKENKLYIEVNNWKPQSAENPDRNAQGFQDEPEVGGHVNQYPF